MLVQEAGYPRVRVETVLLLHKTVALVFVEQVFYGSAILICYPFVMAVGSFGHDRVGGLLRPIVTAAPAFASQLLEAGIEKGVVSFRLGHEGPPMPPEEFGERLREAMGSWVAGIGPLAPLVAPVRADGSLRTLGVSGSAERVSRRSWYSREDDLGEVVPLHEHNPRMLPDWTWPNIRGVSPRRQAAWVWQYALDDLRKEMEKAIKNDRLPAAGGLLAREDAWSTACGLAGGRTRIEPLPLERVEHLLDFFGRDGAERIAIQRGPHGKPRHYRLGNLRAEFARLRDAGRGELPPPWPVEDRIGDPDVPDNGSGGVYAWHHFRPETLLARAKTTMEGAFAGYRRLVEDQFPRLAPQMLVAATLPARLTGTLIMSHLDEHPDLEPYVAWHLEPLTPGSESGVTIEFGTDHLDEEGLIALGAKTRFARPEAAAWISPWERSFSSFYGKKPATALARKLLWDDLKGVCWVEGTFMSGI